MIAAGRVSAIITGRNSILTERRSVGLKMDVVDVKLETRQSPSSVSDASGGAPAVGQRFTSCLGRFVPIPYG